jgi:hypothetical protein
VASPRSPASCLSISGGLPDIGRCLLLRVHLLHIRHCPPHHHLYVHVLIKFLVHSFNNTSTICLSIICMLVYKMATKQCQSIPGRGFGATQALAAYQKSTTEDEGQGLGFSSLRLLVDQSSPDLFPRIEWSNHDMVEIKSRREHLRRLVSQRRLRRASLGLVRSKSMLCLPSATKDHLAQTLRRGSSSVILSTAAAKKKHLLAQSMTNKPLPQTKPGCLKRELSPSSKMWLPRNCKNCNIFHDETQPSLESFSQSPLFQDCPFPHLSINTLHESEEMSPQVA